MKVNYATEVESSRTSLTSRTHFEVLGLGLDLKAHILGLSLEVYKSSKKSCPRLEAALFFEGLKKKWPNIKIDVARIFELGTPNPKITCNMMSSKIFKRRDFLWDKNTLEWKIRSLGRCVNRMLLKRKDWNQKFMFSKYVLNCGGAVKKLM